ncbi:MAG: helix-turn-helix transcriptional regulator [Cyanobacteria bacterium J06632_22]
MIDNPAETAPTVVQTLIECLLEEIAVRPNDSSTTQKCERLVDALTATEARRYGLTQRETEVWLLRQQHYTYQEIGRKLFISPHTVKKHLRNVTHKRKSFLELHCAA